MFKLTKEKIIKGCSIVFTAIGVIDLLTHNATNGFLAIIIGELLDLEYRIRDVLHEKT
jgi:hypothetical protein